jgi:hypothetical protein
MHRRRVESLRFSIEARGFHPNLDNEILAMLFGEEKYTGFRLL